METHVTTGYKVVIVTIPTEHTTPKTEAKKGRNLVPRFLTFCNSDEKFL